MAEHTTQSGPGGGAGSLAPARVRLIALAVAGPMLGLSLAGAFESDAGGSIAYIAGLFGTALVVLLVSTQHRRQASAWRLVGLGITLWAIGGFLLTLRTDAGFDGLPALPQQLCFVVGYLPLMMGLADLSDPQLRTRRLTNVVDGVLLFLVLYAVLWLTVVEHFTVETPLPKLDRAFSALYPAGDLALMMLAVRIVVSHAARRRVGLLLLGGAVLITTADVSQLVMHLRNDDGGYQLPNLFYLCGLGGLALASVWSLLPAPPPVTAGARSSRLLAITVALSALVPPLVLGGIVLFTDRRVELLPVAVWVLLAVCAAVMRHLASVRELERAHQKSIWLASHDLGTDSLGRAAFLHELSLGSMRDRTGSIIVVEILGLDDLRNAHGYDVVDHVVATVAQRLRAAAADDGLLARLAHDQFALFLRSVDLARGRQVAATLQKSLATGVGWGTVLLALPAVVAVAQADGAVIDAQAGVRRAIEALRMGRAHGAGYIAIDADLTGSLQSGTHPSAHHVRREAHVPVAG